MIRFWLDDHEYAAPDSWMRDAIRARRVLGMTANEAAADAMAAWVKRIEVASKSKIGRR